MPFLLPILVLLAVSLLVLFGALAGGGEGATPATERSQPSASPPEPEAPRAELVELRRTLIREGHLQRPFFDFRSAADQRLTTYEGMLPLEVDTPEGLARTQDHPFATGADFVVYQNWGPIIRDPQGRPGRTFLWLAEERARELAEHLRGGPTTKLWLVVTMFGPGALRAFADALGPGQLEMLGLLWYFSGDDFTDEVENAADVAYLTRTLGLRRLSILTAAWSDACEHRLADALEGYEDLEALGVHEKDDGATWPRIATPRLQALCRPRS